MAHPSQRRSCGDDLAGRLRWHVHHCLRQDHDCSIIMLCPVELPENVSTPVDAARALAYLADRLSSVIRRTDAIEIDDGHALAVVLPGAGREGAPLVYQRLRELLAPPPLPGDAPFVLGISYATGAEEWRRECVFDTALRDSCIPRTLVTLGLPPDYRERRWLAPAIPAMPRQGECPTAATPADTLVAQKPERKLAARRGSQQLRLVTTGKRLPRADDALRERARTLGVPFVEIPEMLPNACVETLAPELARELGAVPIGRSRTTLTVAMHNPHDARAVLRLQAATGLAIFPVLASADALDRVLRDMDALAER